MGASTSSESEWLAQLEKYEQAILDHVMIPATHVTKKNITFPYPGAPEGGLMSVRTLILGEDDTDKDLVSIKPTLVHVHGFGGAGVIMYPIFRPLMKHFRLVLIDQIGFGCSTRVEKLPDSCFESVEAMDAYQAGWLTKWMEQMDEEDMLPPKFFLHGHSYGAYIGSLFAC